MKIIDAHLHIFPSEPRTDAMAEKVGHVNSVEHLREVYGQLEIVHGVVMGNRSLDVGFHNYPTDLFHYCVGLDSLVLDRGETIPKDLPDQVEEHLKRENCCGVKLYPGYNKIWLTDPIYQPIYELAARYDKPVAIHMGLTSYSRAYLKYSHPLVLDEAAADNHRTRFVMCHFGNPWLMDAAAVVEKNENVAADLSGLLEGKFDIPEFLEEQSGYISTLKTWLAYIRDYDKLMFGTDWPLANYEDYIEITKRLIPEKYWETVFYQAAERIYHCNF